MNIFRRISLWFILRKMRKDNGFAEVVREIEEKQNKALCYGVDELRLLSDIELYEAVCHRVQHKAWSEDCGLELMSDAQRVIYVTSYYEMEVNNGGLCQFFVNSSQECAPYLSRCLEDLGALEHKKLFDDFVGENSIDLTDLSSFQIDRIEEFEEQTKRYPFDDFDNAFYQLPSIQECSYPFVRAHIEQL